MNLISINTIKFDLHQTALDHEFITSPENIEKLAEEYLELNLKTYKKDQIKNMTVKGSDYQLEISKTVKLDNLLSKIKLVYERIISNLKENKKIA